MPSNGSMFVLNGTSINATFPLPALPPWGDYPTGALYDPVNGLIYAFDEFSDSIVVVNGTTVEATIADNMTSCSVAVDPISGDIYVAGTVNIGCGGSTVAEINGTDLVGEVHVSWGYNWTDGLVFNPANGLMYVGLSSPDQNFLLMNGTSVVGNFTLTSNGSSPGFAGGVYDPTNGYLYVSEAWANSVAVLNGTTLVATLPAGSGVTNPVYDDSTGDVYVASARGPANSSGFVTVLNGTSYVGNVTVGVSPWSSIYEPAANLVCVLEWTNFSVPGHIALVRGTTLVGTLIVGGAPSAASFNPVNGDLYVVDTATNQVTILGEGYFYNITFQEAGIPAGWDWAITLDGSEVIVTSNATTFSLANGTAPYTIVGPIPPSNISPRFRWTESPLPYSGAIVVNGSSVVLPTMVFTVSGPLYAVYFWAFGLPSTATFSVTFNGTTEVAANNSSDLVSFLEPAGNYSYTIGAEPGYAQTSIPGSGVITLSSATTFNGSLWEYLDYLPVSYVATITETGLPAGQLFAVSVNGVAENLTTDGLADTLTWTGLPNGTYGYTITDISGWHQDTLRYHGHLTVDGGTAPTNGLGLGYAVTLDFVQVLYNVTFTELGLPAGTSWGVTVGSTAYDSTSGSLVVALPNGTYSYAVAPLAGWQESTLPSSGTITVDGAAVVEPTLGYSQVTYAVTFTETGLPTGTSWSVVVDSTILYTSASSVTFEEPNGSHAYSIGGAAGYAPSVGSGHVNIDGPGSGYTVAVTFTAVLYDVVFSEAGLPAGTSWSVTVGSTGYSSTTGSLVVALPDGSYSYTVQDVSGWHEGTLAYSGTITVEGAGIVEPTLGFVEVTYAVTFTETGLPSGTEWSVVVDSTVLFSTSTTVTFEEPNGSHAYSVGGVSGYQSNVRSGTVSVTASGASVAVTFTANSTSSLPSWVVPAGVGALTGAVVAVVASFLLRPRAKPPLKEAQEADKPAGSP